MAGEGGHDVSTIAKLLMLDVRRIQQLVKEGWIARDERGRYGLVSSVQGYVKYLKEHTREQSRGTEHARLARAQATKVEMENFRRMGELQTSAQVEETCQGLVVIMKSSIEGLPGRLANELAAITEPPRVYQTLQTELRGVLDRCADFLEKRADSLEAMQEPRFADEAAAPGDPDRLGEQEPGNAAGFPKPGEVPP